MSRLQELQQEFGTQDARLQALLAQESLSAEEQTELQSLDGSLEQLRADIETAQAQDAIRRRALARQEWSGRPATVPGISAVQSLSLPATARAARVRHFSSNERAYAFGQWLLASSFRRKGALDWCRENGLELQAMDGAGRITQLGHNEIVNSQGGFLVPMPLENELIDLREKFGVARQIARVRTMTSETLSIPRRVSGLTAYAVEDEESITESTKGWDRVNLVAKKLGVLSKISSELNEDAIIDVADDLAGEMAYAFAAYEDDAYFNGDGSTTYYGIQGVRSKLQDVDGAGTDSAGLATGAGNLYSELTLADFNRTSGLLPEYADNESVVWVVHKAFWAAVMERLALAAGGITEAMIAAGGTRRFLGYDVVISQKMPSTEANSQVCALLGNFKLGSAFGDRRQTTILVSEHAYFANDQLGVRATERFDINIHDVGSSSAAGPIVGLQTAGS